MPPPRTMVVKRTTIRVVVTRTFLTYTFIEEDILETMLTSSSNSR